MTPKTVFWPLDCTKTGFCYGWDVPAFCVVGVLEGKDRRDAEGILETWNQKNNIKRPLRLLGLCHFTKERPSLMFEDAEDYHIVLYHRHVARSLRFYSLDVLKLDALERPANPRAQLINMHLEHDFTSSRLSAESGGISYRVVEQLNLAGSIDATLQPRKRILATIPTLILAFFTMIFTPVIPLLSSMGWILSVICNVPISFSWDALNLHYVVLKDVSATIQQLDVRAEQALFLAVEVVTLTHKAETPLAAYSARYTSFFNMIWLILNDITIGYAFGTFLSENAAILANLISRHAQHILIDWVQWVLRWLDSWPAGLKLNTELSWFYSHTLVDLVALWSSVLHRIFPYLPIIIRTFGLISSFGGMLGGLTMMISLFCDLLAVFTVHIYVCYVLTNAVYSRALRTAGSLWNLFRGKRYNVLRNRTDSWEYDVDQLLFGTILFTLLAFLFPTILAYYSLFALMRLGTIILQATLETQLAFMNHFPLFALMLRVKDPWRLPGGIYFARRTPGDSEEPVLVLENQPVPLSNIFFQYIQLWSRLASHYNPLRLLKCVFAGEFLSPIPRYEIRYNKIRDGGMFR
ncbi:n-acetylglucosaminyl transferase component gpi1 [Moniliophthora roreri MCA 2997]|uniref:N-acetylglucosaminyl transferase component gpi1 n=1 Tax=Moniliophthora roreri (strain MCA 2997) TaxID=1381753 RepID=V2WUQ9_MONRO|nr:n-acetylglucosaminyl transferase component gpi1 [Moniliophthora roreri MCA 2997]